MSQDPAFLINHELKKHGFASLAESGPLMAQLAVCIRDDRQFRTLLNACEPDKRRDMYEALAPNLRFVARPLALYMIELAQDAEARQLPTIGPGGELQAFKIPELLSAPTFRAPENAPAAGSDEAIATAAAVIAKEHIHVVCPLCTRDELVEGLTKEDVIRQLRKLGWRFGFLKNPKEPEAEAQSVEICPTCVRARAPRVVTV